MTRICAIAAMDQARVIGFNNTLPWHIREDFRRFAHLTKGHSVLMGRKTYQSLPGKNRPLPDRKNIVATRQPELLKGEEGIEICNSAADFIQQIKLGACNSLGQILWVIGGEEIYCQTLPFWDEVYLTLVDGLHDGDAYFPVFEERFELFEDEEKEGFSFLHYRLSGSRDS